MQEVPRVTVAGVCSYLLPEAIGRVLVAFPWLGRDGEDVAELGAWLAVRPSCSLYAGETWAQLYLVLARLSDHGAPSVAVRWLLLGGCVPETRDRSKWSFLGQVGEALVEESRRDRLRPKRRLSERRLTDAARRLGAASRWDLGAELLRLLLGADRASTGAKTIGRWLRRRLRLGPSPAPAPSRWRVQLLMEASVYLVDELYASTYVRAVDEDGRKVLTALGYARRAVAMARQCNHHHDDDVETTLEHQTIDALDAYGRACALAAQHSALGALTVGALRGYVGRIDAAHIFDDGERAFDEATRRAAKLNDSLRVALSQAGVAELWYCKASGLVASNVREPAHIQHLARRSVDQTRRALAVLEALGLGHTNLAARMCKDLGKTSGFLARLFGQPNDATVSSFYLGRALELSASLDGLDHRNTANVARLLGIDDDSHRRHPPPP